jgi:predicted unusual protein kinase regulating ubiquinone biosynthesis (AarF/ABC1/UbiB family)
VKDPRQSRVPSGRLSRFLQLSAAASKIAIGGAKEASSRWLGRSEDRSNVFLTLENATQLADQLSRLRGAAMKLGQMLSLEGDSLLPKQFADALAILRDKADIMPEEQVREVLRQQYGSNFETLFRSFDYQPVASASIGQVHRATASDGRRVALKLQYPGVAESIDSDVDNLASLLSLSRILPTRLEYSDIVSELKKQLREEVDYLRELSQLEAYSAHLSADPRFRVPAGYRDLSTKSALAMEFIYAKPLSEWAENAPQNERNQVASTLVELLLRELFEFGLVQTDPNFSNYFYDAHRAQLVLFDFGATRQIDEITQEGYRRIIQGLISGEFEAMRDALVFTGFLDTEVPAAAQRVLTEVALIGHEVFREHEAYNFETSTLVNQMRARGTDILKVKLDLKNPPAPLLFFQRKVGGTFLMCRKLRASVDCRCLAEPRVAIRTSTRTDAMSTS